MIILSAKNLNRTKSELTQPKRRKREADRQTETDRDRQTDRETSLSIHRGSVGWFQEPPQISTPMDAQVLDIK